MSPQQRLQHVIAYYSSALPHPTTALHHRDAYELLVATVLSAQCTDERVNSLTPALFEQYPDVLSLSLAAEEDIRQLISSITYPNAKARHLRAMAQEIVRQHDGIIPDTMSALQTLPGVGRKTASVVLAVAFHKDGYMPVDTHVFRVAHRLQLVSDQATVLQTEQQLLAMTPATLTHHLHHWLIHLGRTICHSRRPACTACPFRPLCPSNDNNYSKI